MLADVANHANSSPNAALAAVTVQKIICACDQQARNKREKGAIKERTIVYNHYTAFLTLLQSLIGSALEHLTTKGRMIVQSNLSTLLIILLKAKKHILTLLRYR